MDSGRVSNLSLVLAGLGFSTVGSPSSSAPLPLFLSLALLSSAVGGLYIWLIICFVWECQWPLLYSDPAGHHPTGEGIACAGVTLGSQLIPPCEAGSPPGAEVTQRGSMSPLLGFLVPPVITGKGQAAPGG